MLFSVIIPTCQRNELLAKCLDRFAPGCQQGATLQADGSEAEPGTAYEVIVTDDGASEQARALIAEHYPWARWTRGPRRGPASNRNHGASLAKGGWIIFADDDCVPDLQIVSAYQRAREEHPGAKLFEGRTYVDRPRRTLAECAPENETGGYLWSCNFAIERALFTGMGGFDERFPYACMEDVDFRERLFSSVGRAVFVKEAAVCHPWRPRRIPQEFVQYERTLPIYLAAHPEKRSDLSPKYYLRTAVHILLKDAIPSIWRYCGSGFWVGVRHHLFCLRMAMIVLFNCLPEYGEPPGR